MKSTFIPSKWSRFLSWQCHFSLAYLILDAFLTTILFVVQTTLIHEAITFSFFIEAQSILVYLLVPLSLCISSMFPLKPKFFEKEIKEGLVPLLSNTYIANLDDYKYRSAMKDISWKEPEPIEVKMFVMEIRPRYVTFTTINDDFFAVSTDRFLNEFLSLMHEGIFSGKIILDEIRNDIVYVKVAKE